MHNRQPIAHREPSRRRQAVFVGGNLEERCDAPLSPSRVHEWVQYGETVDFHLFPAETVMFFMDKLTSSQRNRAVTAS
jgi:hypothetical protein